MIEQIDKGTYTLAGTKGNHKILLLDNQAYIWITTKKIGQILVFTQKIQTPHYIMAEGKYTLFAVVNEPKLVDLVHLELQVGAKQWQGYLLPTGLPTQDNIRNRLIPTTELVSE